MDESTRGMSLVGDQAAIVVEGLVEPAFLKGEIPEQLDGVIAPGATESLIHHATKQNPIPALLTLAIPALRLRIDPTAIDRPRLRGELGESLLAKAADVDV